MASASDLRRLALALPEAYEDLHRHRPAFRVNARIFAMLGVTGNTALFTSLGRDNVAVVKLDREDQLNMAANWPEAVTTTKRSTLMPWSWKDCRS